MNSLQKNSKKIALAAGLTAFATGYIDLKAFLKLVFISFGKQIKSILLSLKLPIVPIITRNYYC